MDDLEVNLITKVDLDLIDEMTTLEEEAFGKGGIHNEWLMTPLIRHGRVFTLSVNKQLAGVAEFIRDWEDPETVYLIGVNIRKDLRGNGYGTKFLRKILNRFYRKDDIVKVELTVDPSNKAAIRVYFDHFGFEKVDMRKHEYGEGEHRLVMELDLQDMLEEESA